MHQSKNQHKEKGSLEQLMKTKLKSQLTYWLEQCSLQEC